MQNIIMSPEMAFQFMIWSYYYHDILPKEGVSYASYGKFGEADVQKLDEIKETFLKCFGSDSAERIRQQLDKAKIAQERCPFPQEVLDRMFAKETAK